MLNRIRLFFAEQISFENEAVEQQSIQMAAAALLIEVSRADYRLDKRERMAVVESLVKQFDLPEAEMAELVALAQDRVEESISIYQFTKMVNNQYDYRQKLKLIEGMWQVAYADGELDKYEDYLIRKVADLIHVSHSDFIHQKLVVAQQRGVAL